MVADWATYLLKRVPADLKQQILEEAQTQETTPANVVRGVLCNHYRLDCPPRRSSFRPPFKPEADTIFIRLQLPLFDAIKADASRNAQPQRQIILGILEAHYRNGGTPE